MINDGINDGDYVRVDPAVGGGYQRYADGRIFMAKGTGRSEPGPLFTLTDITNGKPVLLLTSHTEVARWHVSWLIPVSKFEARIYEIYEGVGDAPS